MKELFFQCNERDKMEREDFSKRYEKLYTTLLDAIPSSVLLVGRDLRIVSANRNFLDKGQRTLQDTLGKRVEKAFPAVIIDLIDIVNRITQVCEENRPICGKRMTYRAPGVPLRTYYYSIIPLSWQGTVEGALFLMDDVTEQIRLSEEVRRVERHLASIVESVSDIVLSTDKKGKILTWNAAAERLSGYSSIEAREQLFFHFCTEDRREDMRAAFAWVNLGKSPQTIECRLVTKGESSLPVAWILSPMKDARNDTIGVAALGRDLTERRKFEMELLKSQKLAALGVMAGGIAHEIRNPLAICSSSAQFLLKDNITADFLKECAEKIHKGIQRVAAITENLLKFAHPTVQTSTGMVNLIPLIEETVTLVSYHSKTNKIEIKTSFPREPLIVNGIATLLQQVFMNVFLNAINAMPNGGVLDILVEAYGGEVRTRVADTGYGISQDDIDKIYDPFYTTSTLGKGTGLGLSICYSIVREHHGTIDVESTRGEGTTFTVRLPYSGESK